MTAAVSAASGAAQRSGPHVRRIESGYLTTREWEDELALCQSYSFFATPSYQRAWCAHYAADARVVGLRMEADEGRLLLPFVEIRMSRRLRIRALIASPEGGYGIGCSFAGAISPRDAARIRSQLAGPATESVYLVSDPALNVDLGALSGADFQVETDDAFVVPLACGYEHWWEEVLDKRVRRQIRKSVECGLVTSRRDLEGLDDFYRLYESAVEGGNERRPVYSKPFLRDLLSSSGSGTARLYLTMRGDECMAGGILLCGGGSAVAWIGAMSREHADVNGNENRHAQVIRELCGEGFASYNMGACRGLPQVARFKQKFGAEPRRYAKFQWDNPLIAAARRWALRRQG